jgi:hypothetical protein
MPSKVQVRSLTMKSHRIFIKVCHNPESGSIRSLSSNEPSDLYSVKFYPYTKPGDDPVFAFVGGKNVGAIQNISEDFG